jgi:hypothetical protein
VRLFYCNQDVDAYNRTAIRDAFDCIATDILVRFSTAAERNECRSKLHRLTLAETESVPYTIPLAVGYPYMISANIDVVDGLVNGANGTLRCIEQLRSIDAHDDDDYQVPGTPRDCGNNMSQQNKITIWFEFAKSFVGPQGRVKSRPYVLS